MTSRDFDGFDGSYKNCPKCGHAWESLDVLLDDPAVKLVGYQVNFARLELGLLLFTHAGCTTTFSLEAGRLRPLYDGPVWRERRTGLDGCPGYCTMRDVLDLCPIRCECAWVREVMDRVRRRHALIRSAPGGTGLAARMMKTKG